MRSEVSGEMPEDLAEGLSVEKQQEQQLMNKLASQGRLPARPASSFLQKKLQQRIPRPDTVPQRKASIINPAVHCKLSPMPHVQHHDVQPAQLPSVE
ncbi:unnamed protein product [Nippostrongylus brasiliensis]|uniref:Negative elongation factor A n=1 Tax=Nippostrongylus brasiliensis TaxID=27835 RepID=A0A0N4Y2I5_NIPBR|nr:unnamed protein product [Nippostrongylus brasiliensis]